MREELKKNIKILNKREEIFKTQEKSLKKEVLKIREEGIKRKNGNKREDKRKENIRKEEKNKKREKRKKRRKRKKKLTDETEEKEETEEETKMDEDEDEEEDLLKDDNIEVKTFTEKTLDLKTIREMELYEHNYLRNLHGASPLVLNEELNEIAQNYANKLAKEKKFNHSNKKDRELKDKKGQWVGENLYGMISSSNLDYVCGDMTRAWYDEIKNYNFKTGQSTEVISHFTQVIWKNSKEVGFGIAFCGDLLISVANYFPGGNYNFKTTYSEQVLDLIPGKEKSSKDLFDLEKAIKRELFVINEIRKKYNALELELDENLCKIANNYIGEIIKTGSMSTSIIIDGIKHSVNYTIMSLVRGAVYKGGEGVKKWYKELLNGYDFEKNCIKNGKNTFDLIMGKALINREFKKIGFGYYFTEHNNKLYVSAIFDSFH